MQHFTSGNNLLQASSSISILINSNNSISILPCNISLVATASSFKGEASPIIYADWGEWKMILETYHLCMVIQFLPLRPRLRQGLIAVLGLAFLCVYTAPWGRPTMKVPLHIFMFLP